MKLTITSPFGIIVDQEEILSLQAEDATGSFGILPLHADFMTVLGISVLSWQDVQEKTFYCAVNNGIFVVSGGVNVSIATREAVVGEDLADLKQRVLGEFSIARELESKTRLTQERFQAETIRRIQDYLHQEDYFA